MSLKQKVILIQEDKEGYKNQLHSIGKFNGFRGAVEYHKREIQLKNYQQAIIYLKILDDYKSSKHEPETPELYLLEL